MPTRVVQLDRGSVDLVDAVADVEAGGGEILTVSQVGSEWVIVYRLKPKPGPKPQVR